MAINGKHVKARNGTDLKVAETYLAKFDAEHDAEGLDAARMALLMHVNSRDELDPATRAEVRARMLSSWLRLLAIVDGFIDPAWDKNDVPSMNVFPPPNADGVQLWAGADPALINDPVARAKYADAIAANREKQTRYRLQFLLRALNESLPPLTASVEGFIRSAYSSDPGDQAELRAAIDQIITNPARKATLSKLLSPQRP